MSPDLLCRMEISVQNIKKGYCLVHVYKVYIEMK